MAENRAKRPREEILGGLRDRKSKRARSGTVDADTEGNGLGPRKGLLDLPVELLYEIHVYAKNPSLVLVNTFLHGVFRSCPTSVKVKYLIARWHEAYCYGFTGTLPRRSPKQLPVANRPPLPSSDLLENGALVELSWNSRFVPVLPSSEVSYPLSNSAHRSADHYILDYCLRYRLTDLEVLHCCEDVILRSPEFGNIVAATGLWRDTDGLLHPHEPRRINADEASLEVSCSKPVHLRVTELPKRLFQIRKRNDQPSVGEINTTDTFSMIDGTLRHYLRVFGECRGPCPPLPALMVILAIAALHIPTTMAGMPAASAPFNSFEGLPLAKATVVKSAFMVQLLLALGAEPSRKTAISLYIAIRTGWLEGLQQLIERDESKIVEWQTGLEGIRSWFTDQEMTHGRNWRKGAVSVDKKGDGYGSPASMKHSDFDKSATGLLESSVISSQSAINSSDGDVRPAAPGHSTNPTPVYKRRRLLDRANLDSKMLKEAVKYDHWAVANWIRAKGITPDLRTIKLIEMKQEHERQAS